MLVSDEQRKEIRKSNELLGTELGKTPFGQGVYQWILANENIFLRRSGAKEKTLPSGVIVLQPEYEHAMAFPHLKDRWYLGMWQRETEAEWFQIHGRNIEWPPQGFYYPTNLITKEGKTPDLEVTQHMIRRIRYHRSRTVKDFDDESENIIKARDKAVSDTIYDCILDAMTAYGNDPGKRSGGVSFGGVSTTNAGAKP